MKSTNLELILFFAPIFWTLLAGFASLLRVRGVKRSTLRFWFLIVLLLALQSIFNLFVNLRLRPCNIDSRSNLSGWDSFTTELGSCWDDRILPAYFSILLVALACSVGVSVYRWKNNPQDKLGGT